jgi:arylsulfatase A-like enzyme
MSDRRLTGWVALAALLLGGLALAGCRSEADPPSAVAEPINVVLISIDTLRPDHLGCYGYERPTSPNLDRFCAEAATFRQAIAQAPSTLHSHASMLSSLLPHHHQATWGGKTRLPAAAISLAEILQAAGYATAAFTGGGQMDRVFGLDQGFDTYIQPGEEHFLGTARRGIEWIDQQGDSPFFLFLHSYEVHHPYDPSPDHLALVAPPYDGALPDDISIDLLREINRGERQIDKLDLEHIEVAYDGEVRSMDDGFGFLVAALRERGLFHDALIVFTSDHGEEFGEHGVVGWHSHTLYDELLKVPLVIRFPGGRLGGSVVDAQVRSVDIAPTILAALGLPSPETFVGVDLAAWMSSTSRPALLAVSRLDRPPGRDVDSVRTEDWKLYPPHLFQLNTSPQEYWDVSVSRPDVVADLRQRLEEAVTAREPLEPEQVVPDDATLEELRALGYIQ